MPSVAIVGIGRLGGALALALSRSGYEVRELVYRGNAANARTVAERLPETDLSDTSALRPIVADIVIVTTPDPEIPNAAASLADRITPDAVVMHTSGSLASDALSQLSNAAASLHPLVSISDPILGADKFANAYFCIEGGEKAVLEARKIVMALGGNAFSIDTKFKPLYHASAVMASGHFTALEDMAIDMLSQCGLPHSEAKRILIPLVASTLDNFAAQPNEKALTGTFARADVEAFERHIASFENRIPANVRETYLLLAERSLDLAEKAGVSAARVRELRNRIGIAKGKSEC